MAEFSEGLFDKEIWELAKAVYEKKQGITANPELLKTTANTLCEAVSEGYGTIDVDWNTPDHAMLQRLTQNVFQFSAAKNYQQLNDITQALKDENGKLREFPEFREAVDRMNLKYNRDWLQTEYQTAVASATAAARWTEFQSESGTMPMLKYQTVGDDRVRADHAVLDGVTKHINDVFWKTYYPPNGWNCRCEAVQVPGSGTQEVNPVKLPVVPQMFRTNLAENGLIFPKNHPFYTGVPKDVIRRAMQYMPQEFAFRTLPAGQDLFFEEHAILQWEPEAKENRSLAKLLCRNGHKDVKLMPRLHEKESELRTQLYGKKYASKHPTKCPDCFVDGVPVEFKTSALGNLSKRIFQASKQADVALVNCRETLTKNYLERFIKGQWAMKDRLNLKKIIIVNDGKMQVFVRP